MNVFVSQNSSQEYSIIHHKHVISDCIVVLADFDHLNLAKILRTSSLEYLVTIKEPIYPELVPYFYSNLSFHANHIRSRVKGIDIDLSLEKFVCLLYLSCDGVDIHNIGLNDFAYPDGEIAIIISQLLHGDENSGLVKNEEVKYYSLITQVVAKIVFYNLL